MFVNIWLTRLVSWKMCIRDSSNMSDITATIAEKNGLNKDNIDWVIPHQANLRIIDAVACLLYTS